MVSVWIFKASFLQALQLHWSTRRKNFKPCRRVSIWVPTHVDTSLLIRVVRSLGFNDRIEVNIGTLGRCAQKWQSSPDASFVHGWVGHQLSKPDGHHTLIRGCCLDCVFLLCWVVKTEWILGHGTLVEADRQNLCLWIGGQRVLDDQKKFHLM